MNNDIKSVTEKLEPFFQRCTVMPGYKALVYLKDKESLETFTNKVLLQLTEKYVKDIAAYMNNGNDYGMVNFENGSNLIICTFEVDVPVVGEKCHVLFVDNKIREKELLDHKPSIEVYQYAEHGAMVNPKPIYINLQQKEG